MVTLCEDQSGQSVTVVHSVCLRSLRFSELEKLFSFTIEKRSKKGENLGSEEMENEEG